MRLQKTDAARDALLQHGPELTTHDRRLLILSDGRRSVDDIVALLGGEARPALLRLLDRGYLVGAARPATAERVRGGAARPNPDADHKAAAAAPTPAPPPPPPVRRSLAATKMYLLDILQLQRGPEAAALRAAIQASAGQGALIAAILDASAHIRRTSNVSYGKRVVDRVAEIIPEDALDALAARCADPPP